MIEARMIMKIMPSKKEVASQLCDTVPNKTKDSHVSIPFNLAPAHSTRPHNAKKALYVREGLDDQMFPKYWHCQNWVDPLLVAFFMITN